MKFIKYILMAVATMFLTLGLSAKNLKFEHKIIVGYNFGATTPVNLPAQIRSIDAYWPEFTPQLGYRITYNYNPKWGISTGLQLDFKGMGVRDQVKYMHTEVRYRGGGAIRGYFTGKNETRIRTAQVTLPVLLVYKPNHLWQYRIGGYFSYRQSGQFSGDVWDGCLRVNDFSGAKINIRDKGKASFDFGKNMRDIDVGVILGAERTIDRHFGVYGDLSWGLLPIFPSSFKAVDFKMYNIYFTIGMSYKI